MNAVDAHHTVLFPHQHNSVGRVLRQLKKEDSSLFNCACSVSNDANFVEEVSKLYPHLTVVPNLRCGLWYVRNGDPTCYFKSTDGHNGNWSFSTTRLNLHIAELAAARGGCIIVDATRRGKTFPDALTKTVPIWAAVLNRAVAQLRSYHDGNRLIADSDRLLSTYPAQAKLVRTRHASQMQYNTHLSSRSVKQKCHVRQEEDCDQAGARNGYQEWDTALHLPAWISQNERIQIEAKVDQWVRDLVQVTGDVGRIAAVLDKPLRPIWLSQESRMWTNAMTDQGSLPFTPLYLVSASKPNPQRLSIDVGKETVSYSYVPGAGDDEESWAKGLTPSLFWQHQQAVLAAGPHGVNSLVAKLLQSQEEEKGKAMAGPLPLHTAASSLSTSNGVVTDKHHPAPGGLEMSQTTLPAHGLFWIGTSRLALGPAAAAHSSFVWHHVDAVLNATSPSRQDLAYRLKADGVIAAAQQSLQSLPPAAATAVRDCEALATAHKGSAGAYLRVPVASSKLDRHGLQRQLPTALEFVSNHLTQQHRVLLHCDAVHLACFTGCSNDTNVLRFVKPYKASQHTPGSRLLTPDGTPVSKHSIRRVLAIVSRFYPLARPTRGMLKQVFGFFEPPHKLPVPVATISAPATMQAAAATAVAATASSTAADPAAITASNVAQAAVASAAEQTDLRQGVAKPQGSLAENSCVPSCSDADCSKRQTYLTANASVKLDKAGALSDHMVACKPPSPFAVAAEDNSQKAYATVVSAVLGALDRGTKSI